VAPDLSMDIPPTNRVITITGITIVRVADGKVTEEWTEMDTLGMLRQMGLILDRMGKSRGKNL
jgi:predicted ester cyclase